MRAGDIFLEMKFNMGGSGPLEYHMVWNGMHNFAFQKCFKQAMRTNSRSKTTRCHWNVHSVEAQLATREGARFE